MAPSAGPTTDVQHRVSRLLTQKKRKKTAQLFKTYMSQYAQAYEFRLTAAPVSGGDQANLVPINPIPNLSYPDSRSFQLLWIGKELSGIYSARYTASSYQQTPMPLGSKFESGIRKVFEDLATAEGLSEVKCELQ
jgi:hypothetical protein